jgi:hypothetical protein
VGGWQDDGVNDGSIQELSVPYDPGPLTENLHRRRRLLRSRLVSSAITVVVLVALYFWQRGEQRGLGGIAVYGVLLGLSLAWVAISFLRYRRARRHLATVGSGVAVRIGPPGVEVAGLYASWPEVVSLATVKGGFTASPALELTCAGGSRARVPLDQITVFPATLDSTARAYSGGRHGVDLSALDN